MGFLLSSTGDEPQKNIKIHITMWLIKGFMVLCCICLAIAKEHESVETMNNFEQDVQYIQILLQQKNVIDTALRQAISNALKRVINMMTQIRRRISQSVTQDRSSFMPSVSNEFEEEKATFYDPRHNAASSLTVYDHLFTSSQFLAAHNLYRRRLRDGTEPDGNRAREMPDLVWDEKLVADAKTYAEKCIFIHDPEDEIYGENLAYSFGYIADPVEMWYAGRNLTGHYSQVVCATTRQVGCFMTFCEQLPIPEENRIAAKAWYSVCRYWPPIYVGYEAYENIRGAS